MGTVLSMLVTALISVITSLFSRTVAEQVVVAVLFHVLDKIVKSTANTVDDDMVRPILEALRGKQDATARPD